MPARVPRNNGPMSGRLRVALLLALCAAGVAPAASSADPVRPKATPLAILATGAPTRCPSAGEVDGEQLTSLIRRSTEGLGSNAFLTFALFPVLPTPAVVLCDPELAQSNRPLGAFGGATHHDLSSDLVFPGLRALGTPADGLADSELVPGDRVELPVAGPKSQLTVVVATATGARSAHLPALGAPAATAVRIEGTLAAPVAVVERADGEPTRVPITPPSKSSVRVTPKLHGREIRFHGTAAPGTLVTVSTSGGDDADLVVAAASGRFKGLEVRVGPKRRAISVSLISLTRRQAFEVNCTARWSKSRKLADKISCKAIKAARATRGVRQAVAQTAKARRAAAPPLAAPRATLASGAAAPTTVEASLNRLTTFAASELPSLGGDLNGDGRPETLVNNLYDETPRPRLVVSQGAGSATSVPIRADKNDYELLMDSVPDLDGDGRDELANGKGVLITDALAAPTLPAQIDLRALRPTSPRDLDLGLETDDDLFASLLTTSEPLGSVADTTGDGRPEPVLELDGLTAIFPSQAIAPGVRSRLAQVFPLAGLDDLDDEGTSEEALSDASLDALLNGRFLDDMQAMNAADNAGAVVVGGRLVALSPADPAIAPTRPRTLLLRTFGGGSVPTATTSFSATGIPLLLDHDPASGDSLVALFQRTTCGAKRRCLDRVLRINAAGQAQSVIAMRRSTDRVDATFIADGPDADSAVDAAIWRGSGRSTRDVKSAGDNGSIAVLTSAQAGSRQLRSLPVLTRGGKPVQALGRVSSTVLPNGSRWLAAQTSERGRKRTGTYALLGQKP